MKVHRGDILKGINPYTGKKEYFEYLGKETSEMLYNSGFKFRLKYLKKNQNTNIIVSKHWIEERQLEIYRKASDDV